MNRRTQNTSEEDNQAQLEGIRSCMATCKELFDCGAFSTAFASQNHALFRAAIVQLLIHLNDLVRKAANDGRRITSTAHVDIREDVADVTDLITKMRNAACHIGSPLQELHEGTLRFISFFGTGTGIQVQDSILGCDFPDDIAVYFGPYRFYLRRHAVTVLMTLEELYPEAAPR